MSWYTIFYLFSLADKINYTFGALAIVAAIFLAGTIMASLGSDTYDSGDWKIWRRFFFTSLFTAAFFWTTWTLVPQRKDMLLIIAGGSVGEFIVDDENAKAIPADITRFLRKEILEATSNIDNPEAIQEALGLETTKEKLTKLSKEKLIEMLQESETSSTDPPTN